MGCRQVRYLLDSSVWMRSALEQQTLPPDIQDIIGNPNELLGLSIISLWEAAKKHQKGKLPLPMDLTTWLDAAIPAQVQVFPLTKDIIVESVRLPDFPNHDPGDELIVATARVHKLILLTTDTKIKNYRHARIHYFTPVLPKP
jgi:PIN domain nuclease of toxin-antitoxin system